MDARILFVETVRANELLPALLRKHADAVSDLEEHCFDKSYIEFLDEQILLGPRGPEWTARLVRRRAALVAFANANLLRGKVSAGSFEFTVEIDPKERAVVHWEEYAVQKEG